MNQSVEIFISYANPDHKEAAELGQRLADSGFLPHLDDENAGSGQEITADTKRAIRTADFLLVCLSTQATNANRLVDRRQQKFLDFFFNDTANTAFLIPVRLEPCPVPKSLRAFEYEAEKFKLPVDLFQSEGWQELLQTISVVLERRAQVDREFLALTETEFPDEQSLVEDDYTESLLEPDFSEGPENPSSVDEWETELRRVLEGQREYAIERLGSVIEHVEIKIEEAHDRPAAKTAFHKALRRVIESWQPLTEHQRHDSYLLDLIIAYMPTEGFVKVGDMVSTIADLEPQTVQSQHPLIDRSIYMKALDALEACWPFPPLGEKAKAPAYRRYVELLQNRILDERDSSYAVRRLLELGEIHPESVKIQPLIQISHARHALVSTLLEPAWRSTDEPGLTNIYHFCLESEELESSFAKSVSEAGWKMEYDEKHLEHLVLSKRTDASQKITLRILDDDRQKYYAYSTTSVLQKKEEILQKSIAGAAT